MKCSGKGRCPKKKCKGKKKYLRNPPPSPVELATIGTLINININITLRWLASQPSNIDICACNKIKNTLRLTNLRLHGKESFNDGAGGLFNVINVINIDWMSVIYEQM
jgi:hypothetical protein